MRVPKGPTINDLLRRAGVVPAQISLLRPEHRASASDRAKAAESLRRRCPYLFSKSGKRKTA
jgi:hypothetical protein